MQKEFRACHGSCSGIIQNHHRLIVQGGNGPGYKGQQMGLEEPPAKKETIGFWGFLGKSTPALSEHEQDKVKYRVQEVFVLFLKYRSGMVVEKLESSI